MSKDFTPAQTDRIIEMAWEDRTPFEAIRLQFGLNESQVRQLIRKELKSGSYTRWRERVAGRRTKHAAKIPFTTNRFKSSMQRQITGNRISKR
ncbi:TIGR03643 family protein [Flavobacterium sp. Sd200]|uniref:TIGR03643 family protein n=1 Tax=Flavobacterium sp. Sd200 TaxID=2692211 RepID=UPI00136A32CF|nr:TIGR03643 family protein [Flavobacterium sp. Sd200]MXN89607.1 TIGR03643 family protein [Flavobacterium sp. Sd200]